MRGTAGNVWNLQRTLENAGIIFIDAEQGVGGPGVRLKEDIGTASILKDGRAVFNVAGNKYRIVMWINYPYRVAYVRFIGTHRQYDRIDAQTI